MRRRGTTQRSRGFSRGGKGGGRAGKQHVLIWGDPKEEMPWEVSRGHSTGGNDGKGRTGWWASDRGTDIGADDIRMDEDTRKCRADGKHGMLGASSSGYAVRWGETLTV